MLESAKRVTRARHNDKITDVAIRWRLPELLEEYDITGYQIGVELGGHKKMPVIYNLTNPAKRPSRVNFATMSDILSALRSLTGEDIQLTDLIEYTPDE